MNDDRIAALIKQYQREKRDPSVAAGAAGAQLPAGIDQWLQEVAEGAVKMALESGMGADGPGPTATGDPVGPQSPPRTRPAQRQRPEHDELLQNLQANLARDGFDINGEIEKLLRQRMGDGGDRNPA